MLTIARATPADLAEIISVLKEADDFYAESGPEPGASRSRQVSKALFAAKPRAHGLLAYDGERATGFASYSYLRPSALSGKSLCLRELYVARNARRRGIGAALMRHVLSIAGQDECGRVEWTASLGNITARRFCESLGFSPFGYTATYRTADFQVTQASERPARPEGTARPESPGSATPFNRITTDPGQLGGQPCIRGHDMSVEDLLRMAGAGWTLEQIRQEFTFIEAADIQQATAYASLLIRATFLPEARH